MNLLSLLSLKNGSDTNHVMFTSSHLSQGLVGYCGEMYQNNSSFSFNFNFYKLPVNYLQPRKRLF